MRIHMGFEIGGVPTKSTSSLQFSFYLVHRENLQWDWNRYILKCLWKKSVHTQLIFGGKEIEWAGQKKRLWAAILPLALENFVILQDCVNRRLSFFVIKKVLKCLDSSWHKWESYKLYKWWLLVLSLLLPCIRSSLILSLSLFSIHRRSVCSVSFKNYQCGKHCVSFLGLS